ncbi:MAG: beta-N-acetylhexosaminidase [Prevotella sp.]|nr:beta-N-acetylhexosaminidase [Prevotella sp.]
MKKTTLSILILVFVQLSVVAQELVDFNVVPLPQERVTQKGAPLLLSDIQAICYKGGENMRRNAEFLSDYIFQNTGKRLEVTTNAKGKNISMAVSEKISASEGYTIKVSNKGVVILGGSDAGVFYGVQTFRKALPIIAADKVILPAVLVTDAPRFSYRGMHLDVSRHFFDVNFIKEYLEMLALHHINVFHFHITDDQGWRLPIDKFPRLTEVGAYRNTTVIGRNTGLYNHQRYGGYYTKQELRDIVEYARQRYITVIPEIDMPGHMEAALAAYPELGCTGGPYEVEDDWGVFDDILCAGKEETFHFVEGVLDELMDLFPSEYIHIGGDEAPRTRWKDCPLCQARIKQQGLTGDGKHSAEDKLQGYFMKRVEEYLNQHGRKVIGWDELLDCDVNKSATIMSWRGQEGGIMASQMGHDVIMVPTSTSYYDYYQVPEDDYWSKPLLIGGYVPLDTVYNAEPAPDYLSPDATEHIIGVQANLWTEYIPEIELAEYQVLPRMGALAEVQWTMPEKKDYKSYLQRQNKLTAIYRQQGWKYCDYSLKEKKLE